MRLTCRSLVLLAVGRLLLLVLLGRGAVGGDAVEAARVAVAVAVTGTSSTCTSTSSTSGSGCSAFVKQLASLVHQQQALLQLAPCTLLHGGTGGEAAPRVIH